MSSPPSIGRSRDRPSIEGMVGCGKLWLMLAPSGGHVTAPPLKARIRAVSRGGLLASGGHVTAPPLKVDEPRVFLNLGGDIGRSRDRPSIEGSI